MSDWNGLAVEERIIRSGDLEIAVTNAGEGPALVLLHGIGSRGVSWLSVAEELAREFRLVILDLRGHGASAHPEHGYLLPDYSRDLDAVLEAFQLERPLIMGHSLGGMTALEWAISNPNRAAAIVIEDSPMTRGGAGVDELFDGWIALSQMTVSDAETYYASQNPAWSVGENYRRAVSITSVAPGVFEDMKSNMVAQNGAVVIPTYGGITSPALLVYGDMEHGGMIPGVLASMFAATVNGAEVVNIPTGTHGLHRDNKDEFLAIVLPFLRSHADGASRLG